MISTLNPVLARPFTAERGRGGWSEEMTVEGTIHKGLAMLSLAFGGVAFAWTRPEGGALVWVVVGLIGGLVTARVVTSAPAAAPAAALIYAVFEGLFLGALSVALEPLAPEVWLQTVGLTFGVALSVLCAYRVGWLRAKGWRRSGALAAAAGVALTYLVSAALDLFGVYVYYAHEGGSFGVLFNLFIVAVTAFHVILDIASIEDSVEQRAPKRMEWVGAFGLTVALAWLYVVALFWVALLAATNSGGGADGAGGD